MIYPGVYYRVRAPISGMAVLLCREARRAIILAFVSDMPRPHPCHTSLSDLSQELWIDGAVTLTGSYKSADADAQFQLLHY